MEFVPAIAMMALIWKSVDLIKSLKAGATNQVVSIILTWVVSVAVVLLYAQTQWADGIAVADRALSDLNIWSQIVVGLNIAGGAGALYDLKKSIDNTDSAATPRLLGPDRVAKRQRVID